VLCTVCLCCSQVVRGDRDREDALSGYGVCQRWYVAHWSFYCRHCSTIMTRYPFTENGKDILDVTAYVKA